MSGGNNLLGDGSVSSGPAGRAQEPVLQGIGNLWLNRAETFIYAIIAILLLVSAMALLASAALDFAVRLATPAAIGEAALAMLNQLLLVLMIIELFYTIRVSLRDHTLIAEPFLIVGLIAAVRRILIITAEAWHLGEAEPHEFNRAMIELGLLTVMTLVIVVSIILLRRFGAEEPTKNA